MQELGTRWETVCTLSVSKQTRLEEALRQVGSCRDYISVITWIPVLYCIKEVSLPSDEWTYQLGLCTELWKETVTLFTTLKELAWQIYNLAYIKTLNWKKICFVYESHTFCHINSAYLLPFSRSIMFLSFICAVRILFIMEVWMHSVERWVSLLCKNIPYFPVYKCRFSLGIGVTTLQ